MALPTNILQNVQTYQPAQLAYLQNSYCAISKLTNKKFKDFDKETGNLGDTVTFDIAPRSIGYNGLVITQQQSQQRVQPLTVTQAVNIAQAFDAQQFIFNTKDYMQKFGIARTEEFGAIVEADLLKNITSSVRINDPQNSNYGALQTNSGPYRFYGNGVTVINSFTQLAQALANFRAFGSAKDKTQAVLPMEVVPSIIGTGLQQFAPDRNNTMANSWELGEFSKCSWMESNLLPTHVAGTVGDTAAPGNVLTLVSTNDPTGVNVTQLTFSGAVNNDANAIKNGDMAQFNDGVGSLANVRFRTFIGHHATALPFQFRFVGDAGANGSGNVTVTVSPPIVWAQNLNQNINVPLAAGMQVTVLPSHKAGVILSGDQFYMAMPQLPDEIPFPTVSMMDKDSGVSMRNYYGSQFGQNVKAYVNDGIWGSTMVQDNCMRLIFPV